jgi:peptide/nickel transport system substrate-binding protein
MPKRSICYFLLGPLAALVLTSCLGKVEEVKVTQLVPETIVETIVEKETVTLVVEPSPSPIPSRARTLVVCMAHEPDTLYIYGAATMAARHVHQALYDGPIANRTYSYQPVILEKLPSLSDGDAVIETVTVAAGDPVVNDAGDPVILEQDVLVRPAGCHASPCAVPFDGTPLEMEQMVVTFRWKTGLLWADGEPLTAYDSVYSFELYMDPDTPVPSHFVGARTASYRAVDDYTNVWTGLPGFRDATYFLNVWHPLPEHLWGQLTALELIDAAESSRRPIGWGPFVVDEWVAGDHLTLSRNPHYSRADEGLPFFDRVVFRIVGTDPNANLAALLAGECDIVDHTASLESQSPLLLELNAAGQLNVSFAADTRWEQAAFGINPDASYQRPDLFQDVRVRRALAHCMDRQAIVDRVLFGQSVVMDTYLPPEHPLFNPDVPSYGFDVPLGSALLEEVGWIDDDGDPATPRVAHGVTDVPDGTLLQFNYWTTTALQSQAAAEILQASLAQCGVHVNLEYRGASELLSTAPPGPIFGRRFDVAQLPFDTAPQPPCQLYLSSQIPAEENDWTGYNISGFTDPEYDLACNAALQSLPGEAEYASFHLQAQRLFAEQLPVLPLYLQLRVAATRPGLQGLILDPTAASEMWNIAEFHYTN